MKRLIALAALALLAAPVPLQASGEDIAASLKRNVVRIEAKLGEEVENGFGFVIGQRGENLYIVTANHVVCPDDPSVAAPKTVKVEFFDRQGESFDAAVLNTHDTAHDLAVLTVPSPPGFQWTKRCLGRPDEPKRSTDVWFIGKGQQWYVPVSPGRVTSEEIIDGLIDLEGLTIVPGSSGGPLLDSLGIVGIILRDHTDAATALDIRYVKSRFKQWNHPYDLDRAEVVAQATPAPAPAPADQPAPGTRVRPSSSLDSRSVLTALVGSLATARARETRDRCIAGYVWREAKADDHVCVTPETRTRTATENARAAAYRDPNGGPYGPDTCLAGYVWREAYTGDRVCVVARSRAQAASDNQAAQARIAP